MTDPRACTKPRKDLPPLVTNPAKCTAFQARTCPVTCGVAAKPAEVARESGKKAGILPPPPLLSAGKAEWEKWRSAKSNLEGHSNPSGNAPKKVSPRDGLFAEIHKGTQLKHVKASDLKVAPVSPHDGLLAEIKKGKHLTHVDPASASNRPKAVSDPNDLRALLRHKMANRRNDMHEDEDERLSPPPPARLLAPVKQPAAPWVMPVAAQKRPRLQHPKVDQPEVARVQMPVTRRQEAQQGTRRNWEKTLEEQAKRGRERVAALKEMPVTRRLEAQQATRRNWEKILEEQANRDRERVAELKAQRDRSL